MDIIMNMIDKNVYFSLLLEVYGELLTEKQREIFKLYYDEDFSLAEIAEDVGVTRQAVLDTIRKSERNLLSFEQKLKIIEKRERVIEVLGKIKASNHKDEIDILIDEIDGII